MTIEELECVEELGACANLLRVGHEKGPRCWRGPCNLFTKCNATHMPILSTKVGGISRPCAKFEGRKSLFWGLGDLHKSSATGLTF